MNLPEYLTRDPHGEIRLTGQRIGLAHVVRAYQRGEGAEMIALRFPTLPLAAIHRVIAFYLENAEAVDAYVAEADAQLAELRRQHPAPSAAELRARLLAQPPAEQARRGA